MKRALRLFGLLLLTAGTAASIAAQEKRITEAEITALRNKAAEKLNGQKYRIKMTSGVYRNPNSKTPTWTNNSIIEYAPEGSRSITEINNNGQRSLSEMITLGERRFMKTNNEAWEELPATQGFGGGSGVAVSSEEKVKRGVEYKYLGKKMVDDRETDLYEIKTTTKITSRGKTGVSVVTERFWFSRDNQFIKTESESRYDDKPVQHTVRRYEYDPNIKIVAPIK